MTLCWAFRLDAVASRLLYRERVRHTQTVQELTAEIAGFRAGSTAADWEDLPV